MRTPILQKYNPQREIGICKFDYEADWITVTLNDGEGIVLGNLLNISLGSIEVLEYESEKDQIVKRFAIKSFIIEEKR